MVWVEPEKPQKKKSRREEKDTLINPVQLKGMKSQKVHPVETSLHASFQSSIINSHNRNGTASGSNASSTGKNTKQSNVTTVRVDKKKNLKEIPPTQVKSSRLLRTAIASGSTSSGSNIRSPIVSDDQIGSDIPQVKLKVKNNSIIAQFPMDDASVVSDLSSPEDDVYPELVISMSPDASAALPPRTARDASAVIATPIVHRSIVIRNGIRMQHTSIPVPTVEKKHIDISGISNMIASHGKNWEMMKHESASKSDPQLSFDEDGLTVHSKSAMKCFLPIHTIDRIEIEQSDDICELTITCNKPFCLIKNELGFPSVHSFSESVLDLIESLSRSGIVLPPNPETNIALSRATAAAQGYSFTLTVIFNEGIEINTLLINSIVELNQKFAKIIKIIPPPDLDDDAEPAAAAEAAPRNGNDAINAPIPLLLQAPNTRPLLSDIFLTPANNLSPKEFDRVIEFREQSDYHNNYGNDFIPPNLLIDEDYSKCFYMLSISAGWKIQSGASSDDNTLPSLAWKDIKENCQSLFGMTPLVIASHSSDLLPYILSLHERSNPKYLPRGAKKSNWINKPIQIVSFQYHYFTMGFVTHTKSILNGGIYAFKAIAADATNQSEETEEKALNELTIAFRKQRSILVMEALCIPGEGKQFHPRFLNSVQKLCKKFDVPIVFDETLSAIRCGYPLLSTHYYGLKPSYVMIGKGFGSAVLLAPKPEDENIFESALTVIGPAYQVVHLAFILRYIIDNKVVDTCKIEGEKIKEYLSTIVGKNNVKGMGMALWVNEKKLYLLPISSSIHGRLLPRIDQTVSVLKNFIENNSHHLMKEILAMGREGINEGRLVSCSSCSASDGEMNVCQGCLRVYHTKPKNIKPECRKIKHCVCSPNIKFAFHPQMENQTT
jgi:hypothetical protein